MMRAARYLLLPLLAYAAIATVAAAQVSTPVPPVFEFTRADVRALAQAIQNVQTAPASEIDLTISALPVAQMPGYDPIAHYAGLKPGSPHSATIDIRDGASQADVRVPLLAALELACMDTGFAGARWKMIYDEAAAADAALPAGASDPWANRHALVAKIQQMLGAT